MTLEQLFQEMVAQGASDLHIKSGHPPCLRVDGVIVKAFKESPSTEDVVGFIGQLMSEGQQKEFLEEKELDFSADLFGLGRFRINAFTQSGTPALVFRHITTDIPDISTLNLPEVLNELALRKRGLILVTGTTGSGKSTALASMIDFINETKHKTIITIEDPVEFIHKDKKSYIYQKDVGYDSHDFKRALKSSLRQDPDVILIGEIRDREAMSIALTAADTGHLVFATLHTTNAADTLARILGMYEPQHHNNVRTMVATVLTGIISMRLLKKVGGSRIPASEILINTPHIKECILDVNKRDKLQSALAEGHAQYKTQTFDQSIYTLYTSGLIDYETGLQNASNPADFELKVSGVSGESDRNWIK